MKIMFKQLHSTTLTFGQTHQLTSCLADVCMAFSTFRIWAIVYISHLQIKCGKMKVKMRDTKTNTHHYSMLTLQLCSLLRHRNIRSLEISNLIETENSWMDQNFQSDIPDLELMQLTLLMTSTWLLETCRELEKTNIIKRIVRQVVYLQKIVIRWSVNKALHKCSVP